MTAAKERPTLFSGPMVRAILDGRKTMTRRVVKCAVPPSCKGFPREANGDWGIYLDRPAGGPYQHLGKCPYGRVGGRLWVREGSLFRSDCGKFLCRLSGGGCGEAWTVDGKTHWINDTSNPVRPAPYCVGAYSCEKLGQKKGSFTLNLLRCNTRKKIIPLTGNTIIESQDVVFRRRVPGIHMPRWASRITLEITGVRVERLREITPADAVREGFEPTMRNEIPAQARFRELWDRVNGHGAYEANPWVWVVSFNRVSS
jgi:hypothetical protein